MKAEIITIGDEILIGQIVDTNSAWIAERLNGIGMMVGAMHSVADKREAITGAVSEALAGADLVVVTGGLGPTNDDITKKTLADMFGSELQMHASTYEANGRMLAARGVEYNELNRSQAMLPACCKVLPNRNGTAPGMWFENGRSVLVSLPGVPFEMKRLMDEEVMPRLRSHFESASITHKTMVTTGIAESVLAETIADWEARLPEYMKLAYLPSPSGVRLRLSVYDKEGAAAEIDGHFAMLETVIPDFVLGYGDASVYSSVAELLLAGGKTLSVAESCTGGMISSRFTAMAGASEYFLCGVTSYSNNAKVDILGVDAGCLSRCGAVSREVAEQMAAGVRRISGSDYAISTTGIAGPGGGTDEKPVGTVWMALAHPDGVISKKMTFGRLREQNIERASASAANMLRTFLKGIGLGARS